MLESQAAASVFREYSRHSSECSKDAIDSAAVYTHDDDDDELQIPLDNNYDDYEDDDDDNDDANPFP